jgi:hypothetical protein
MFQKRRTFHPDHQIGFGDLVIALNIRLILSCQNRLFCLGRVAWSGQACQKQPSTKTATLLPEKQGPAFQSWPFEAVTQSRLPEGAAQTELGPVFRFLILDMQRRRCSGVMTSVFTSFEVLLSSPRGGTVYHSV